MKDNDPLPLRDALSRVAADLGFDASTERSLHSVWEEVVGVAAAAHAEPGGVRDGTLRVWVDSGAWATELRYLASEFVERLTAAGIEGVDCLQISVRGSSAEARRTT